MAKNKLGSFFMMIISRWQLCGQHKTNAAMHLTTCSRRQGSRGAEDRPTRDSPAPGIGRVRPDVDVVLLVGDEADLPQVHGLVAPVEADVALPA